jgi:anti-sigma B factor antagonist
MLRRVFGELGQLVITSTQDGSGRLLTLVGELDLASAPLLDRELAEAESANERRLVVDLSGVEFIDSIGLGLLVSANERSRQRGCEFSCVDRVRYSAFSS